MEDKLSSRPPPADSDAVTKTVNGNEKSRPSSALLSPQGNLSRRNSVNFNVKTSKVSEVLATSVQREEEQQNYYEKFRIELKKSLTNSSIGIAYEYSQVLISVVGCLEYIYHTYKANPGSQQDTNLEDLELGLAAAYAIDWCLNLFLADNVPSYLLSFYSVVDMLSITAIYSTYKRTEIAYDEINSAAAGFLYIMFGCRTVRILRALIFGRTLNRIEDAVERYIGELCLAISIMILFFAAVMQFLESSRQPFFFHTWMYFIWVTISTVGYGDITPQTTLGRFAAMFMIAFALISVPKMTNELIEKTKLQSVYARSSYIPRTKNSKHVIICGDISSTSLYEFYGELFHEDHENTDLRAVMLLPHQPSVDIIFLMRDPKYFLQLTYLEGSALLENDLRRAKAERASAIFIMTNKFSTKPDEEDSKSILLNLSVKRYISYFIRPSLLYCMQLIRPENRKHLGNDDFNQPRNDNDLVVCLNELKLGVMARSIMYPGTNTLIMNLLSSFSDEALNIDDDLSGGNGGNNNANNNNNSGNKGGDMNGISMETDSGRVIRNSSTKDWVHEYLKGCGWEIYLTRLSKVFVGAKFCELSYALYDKLGVLLFALQITDVEHDNFSKVLLNPANYIIPDQGKFRIEAFVIAQNQQSSDLSFSSSGDDGDGNGRDQDNNPVSAMAGLIKSSISDHSIHAEDRRRSTFTGKLKVFTGGGGAGGGHGHHAPPINGTTTTAQNRPHLAGVAEDDNSNDSTSYNLNLNPTTDTTTTTVNMTSSKKSKWNLLKRSALLKKKVETSNYQEILVKLEDEHFYKNYYVRLKPSKLSEVTIKTSVLEEIPHINQHLIIMGKGLKNLYDLIRPLRAKYLGPLRYIVLLYPQDIPPDVWQRISVFEALLFVRGSPLEESNLRRAGIFRAAKVVVLGDGSMSSSSTSVGMEALVDSEAIFAYQHVRRMNPSTQVVIEIVNQSNIGYLDDATVDANVQDYKFSSQFAGGLVFTTSLLDSIVCQAYYNPPIIKVVNRLLSGADQAERADLADEATKRVEEGEDSDEDDDSDDDDDDNDDDNEFNTDSSSRKLKKVEKGSRASSSKKKKKKKKKPPLSRMQSRIMSIPGSCLYQVGLPDKLEKKTYGALFQVLASLGQIPLGILRGTFTNMNIGPKSNKLPYVFTNPDKDTELYSCDRIFVLSTTPVQSAPDILNVKDWVMNIQMQQNLAKQASESGASSSRKPSLSKAAVDVAKLEKSQRRLSERIERMERDVYSKIDVIMNMAEKRLDRQLVPLPSSLSSSPDMATKPPSSSPTTSDDEDSSDNRKTSSSMPPVFQSPNNAPRKVSFSEPTVSILRRPSNSSVPAISSSPLPAGIASLAAPTVAAAAGEKRRPSFSDPILAEATIIHEHKPLHEEHKEELQEDDYDANSRNLSGVDEATDESYSLIMHNSCSNRDDVVDAESSEIAVDKDEDVKSEKPSSNSNSNSNKLRGPSLMDHVPASRRPVGRGKAFDSPSKQFMRMDGSIDADSCSSVTSRETKGAVPPMPLQGPPLRLIASFNDKRTTSTNK